VARDQGLLTKQFFGDGEGELWLNIDELPRELNVEQKLSQLTRWILEAHAAGLTYGLKLSNAVVPLGRGGSHRECCLRALALFEGDATQARLLRTTGGSR
jgi:uncharacterized protein (DUF58 family)